MLFGGDFIRIKAPSESSIQCSYLEWLSLQYPKCFKVTFSIPNGGKRTSRFGHRLKREGMKSGVPDLFMAYPSNKYHGLFIEFKKDGGKLSEIQREMIGYLCRMDYKIDVCYSLEAAVEVTTSYLVDGYDR